MPIFTLSSRIALKDFVPAAPEPSPLQAGIIGLYNYTNVTAGPAFTASRYVALQSTVAPDFTVCSSTTPQNWFKIREVGNITLVLTATYVPDKTWDPSVIYVDGVKITPIAAQKGTGGC